MRRVAELSILVPRLSGTRYKGTRQNGLSSQRPKRHTANRQLCPDDGTHGYFAIHIHHWPRVLPWVRTLELPQIRAPNNSGKLQNEADRSPVRTSHGNRNRFRV